MEIFILRKVYIVYEKLTLSKSGVYLLLFCMKQSIFRCSYVSFLDIICICGAARMSNGAFFSKRSGSVIIPVSGRHCFTCMVWW